MTSLTCADAEQGGDARHQVLAERGGRAEHVRVAGSQLGNLRRQHGGERLGVGRVRRRPAPCRRRQSPRPARRRPTASAASTSTSIDAPGTCAAQVTHLRGARVQLRAVVFGNDQDLAHHTNPFFLSASTSSPTSFTMTPFCRCGGGSTRTVLNGGASATPKSASPTVSSGFFLAFMMSGSFT